MKSSIVAPIHAECKGRVHAEAEGEGAVFEIVTDKGARDGLKLVIGLVFAKCGVCAVVERNRKDIAVDLRAFELSETCAVIEDGGGVVGGGGKCVATGGGEGVDESHACRGSMSSEGAGKAKADQNSSFCGSIHLCMIRVC